jgi:hypothetical protein
MTDPPLQSWSGSIASDIHKHYLLIGGIDAHKRIVLTPRRVELSGWREWAQANLLPTDAVVLEATTNAWALYDLLVTLVGRAVVAHPAKGKLIADARVKTDKVDVLTLAHLLRADRLPEDTQRVPGATAARPRPARAALPPPATGLSPDECQESAAECAAAPQRAAAPWRAVRSEAACLVGGARALTHRALASGSGYRHARSTPAPRLRPLTPNCAA